MANTINPNYLLYTKQAGQIGRASAAGKGNKTDDSKDLLSKFGNSSTVEISEEGLSALSKLQNAPVTQVDEDSSGSAQPDAQKLSPKAQAYLENLRKQYGDYDFIITDKIDNPQELAKQGTKAYSVILTNEELEKMANDEEYANEVMGKVKDAIGVADRIAATALEDGVQFKHVAIAFDEDGNTRMFAELEKLSEKQQERLEKLKEKKAEEKEKAEKQEEKDKDREKLSVKRTTVEATSEEELLEKILGIDWDSILEEE